ncbi:IS481 family transposase, partial [Bradyrhizobium sp. 18]|nr:IS481 family transposase [Bradyrhizobium sp. 18]
TGRTSASTFLEALIAAVPYKIHTVLTDNGIQFMRVSRDREHGFQRIVSNDFRGS